MSNSTYIVENGYQKLQLSNGALVDVMAPLSLEEGAATRLIEVQRLLLQNCSDKLTLLVDVAGGSTSAQILAANDLNTAYTYLDAGTIDQRIATITYSSTSVGASFRETYSYAGSSGGYYVTGVVRAIL